VTVKEEIHRLIDALSNEDAEQALEYLRQLARTRDGTNQTIEEMIGEGGPVPPSTSNEFTR